MKFDEYQSGKSCKNVIVVKFATIVPKVTHQTEQSQQQQQQQHQQQHQ